MSAAVAPERSSAREVSRIMLAPKAIEKRQRILPSIRMRTGPDGSPVTSPATKEAAETVVPERMFGSSCSPTQDIKSRIKHPGNPGNLWRRSRTAQSISDRLLAGVSRGEKENAGSGRRMNGIALVFRIYHAFGQ